MAIGLHNFPNGACGDASLLLIKFLRSKGVERLAYVSGRSASGDSHAWAQADHWYVDITGDQRDFGRPPVVVDQPGGWFDQWQDRTQIDAADCGFTQFARPSMAGYDVILRGMA